MRTKLLDYGIGIIILGYLYFNRNPSRNIPIGDNIVSPADGTIVDIKNNNIEIFIGLLDVHFQRAPFQGQVTNIIEKIPTYNVIELSTPLGYITIERWAGEIAKTVDTFIKPGQYVEKGDVIGRILLGSHCAVTIPQNLDIKVVKGQHVIAGETILAWT